MDQIYSATYSGVEVYELLTSTGSVMMRQTDGWVNATHILKTANFPKAKRTRILERDVQIGTHDKVQGGYGKYQGTYVPLDRAKAIAVEFGVADVLDALFNARETYAKSPPPPAPKHHHATKNNSLVSSKPKSQRKAVLARKVASMPIISTANEVTSSSSSSKKKKGRPKKADPKMSNPNEGVFVRRRLGEAAGITKSLQMTDSFEEDEDNAETDVEDETGVEIEMESEAELNENDGLDSDIEDSGFNLIDGTSSPSEFMSDADLANALKSPAQQVNPSARESLVKAIHNNNVDNMRHERWIDPNVEYTGRLLDYFLQPDDATTESRVPDFLIHPPKGVNLDQVIDEEGHTTFHWACSMGNPQVVEALMNLGANYRAVNNAGETPLMRAAQFTNAYTKRTFSRLVEMLGESIFELDTNFRSILHHISAAANSKARIPSSVYYMEIIIAKISESQTPQRLEEFINLQDRGGDTALHICAQNANKKCIKILVYHKAKGNIRNNNGRVASDILLENENITPKVQQRYELHLRNKGAGSEIPTPANSTINTSDGTAAGLVAPRVSEAAIEATHKVAQILMESLQELSTAYDYELKRKEADATEVQELVSQINQDIRSTHEKTKEHLGEGVDIKVLEQRVKLMEDQMKRHETLVQSKETKLKRVLERSQKKSLESMSLQFESEQLPTEGSDDVFEYAAELTRLQFNRKRLITQVLSIASGVDTSNEKMQKYRRLISTSAEIPIGEVSDKVDDLLKEIENGV